MIDCALIQGCLNNDAKAQKALYDYYSATMLTVCCRYARNRQDAEDMLQEGFIKVFSHMGSFRGDGALGGWIRRIMVHTCINHLKRNKHFLEDLEGNNVLHIEAGRDSAIAIMHAKDVMACMRLLPEGYRTVLNLFAIEGYSHKEIGEMLDIEESSSRSQYSRAKSTLENILVKKKLYEKVSKPNNNISVSAKTNNA